MLEIEHKELRNLILETKREEERPQRGPPERRSTAVSLMGRDHNNNSDDLLRNCRGFFNQIKFWSNLTISSNQIIGFDLHRLFGLNQRFIVLEQISEFVKGAICGIKQIR